VKETYKINDLEQMRLLTDPLKLQLLHAFAEDAKTTKQVASELGESVTKLYRHVDALHDAGLLVISGEKQKRGTIERTFRAVAERFEADQSLFADEMGEEASSAIRDMLRAGETEILNAIANADNESNQKAIVMRLRCKASPERIAELRDSLSEWCKSVQDNSEHSDEDAEEFGGLIAFYPID
jgi:predicted ArsR family transcriptional regulator